MFDSSGAMTPNFASNFDALSGWRSTLGRRLAELARYLLEHDLADGPINDSLASLAQRLAGEKLVVAFVAEFSRGKSELINAIFFAGYGRRIMPASAGRTTMCPTELGYDAAVSPKLRLLPIETRLEPHSLTHWREKPTRWTEIAIDVENAEQLAQAMGKVAEVRWVSKDEANALGFWNEETPDDNPVQDAEGRVEIPRWRHAILNMPHPLLEQGLVILDTPGLNAIGAEPELTVSLIPQAHAVVFILGAETGVTRSDLSIWREHLVTESEGSDTRFVVLNKIDTMWDPLRSKCRSSASVKWRPSFSRFRSCRCCRFRRKRACRQRYSAMAGCSKPAVCWRSRRCSPKACSASAKRCCGLPSMRAWWRCAPRPNAS
jgi:hypothetical protein